MSTVIKAGQAGQVLPRLTTIDLSDHLAEAHGVVQEARRQADQIIAHARREAVELRSAAKKRGYDEGYRSGRDQGTAAGYEAAHLEAIARFEREHADLVAAMQRTIGEIDARKEDLRIAAEKHLLDFAVTVAGKLTFAIGRLHREAARANLRRAIDLVGAATKVTIRVHPDDRASLETFAESVLRRVEASPEVRIVADDSLAPGGCQVEAGGTSVDARLETQLEELLSVLLGEAPNDV